MPKRVDHEERRRQIADALLRTAVTRGLHATGMREVAAEAGVSLRLVQYYFGTKEELLLAAMQHLAARFSERGLARIRQLKESAGALRPCDVIAAILTEGLPADDERRTFTVLYTAYFALSLTDPALAIAPLVANSGAVINVVAAQLRAAQAAGDTPAHLDPDLEAFGLLAMSAGLGTSVLGGQSSVEQAQAVIDYHLHRLFPASRPALRRAPPGCMPAGPAVPPGPALSLSSPEAVMAVARQGELDEAERWLMEGEYALRSEAEPATGMLFHLVRGLLEIARGRGGAALAAVAALRLAQDNPRAATAAHAPVLDSPAPGSHQVWLIVALLLEASAQDALGEREAAGRALERGLDLAEPDGLLLPFLLHPVPELLERQARQRTAHPALIRKIISTLRGRTPGGRTPSAGPPTPAAAPPAAPAPGLPVAPAARPEHLPEPLSQAEARVLRFLQTSLSAPEIARELYVSVNTVRTHMRHLYDKLGAHRRLEALDRARALGLLTPVPQRALPGRSTSRVLSGLVTRVSPACCRGGG